MEKVNMYWQKVERDEFGNKSKLDKEYLYLIFDYKYLTDNLDTFFTTLDKILENEFYNYKSIEKFDDCTYLVFDRNFGNVTNQKKQIQKIVNKCKLLFVMLSIANNNSDLYEYQDYIYSMNIKNRIDNEIYKEFYILSKSLLK